MLEIVSGERGRGIDFAEKWNNSPEREALRKEIDDLVNERKERPENTSAAAKSEFSAAPWTQVVEVTKRQLRDTWRDAPFAYGILFSNFVTGEFFWVNIDLQVERMFRILSHSRTLACTCIHQV